MLTPTLNGGAGTAKGWVQIEASPDYPGNVSIFFVTSLLTRNASAAHDDAYHSHAFPRVDRGMIRSRPVFPFSVFSICMIALALSSP